MTFYLRMVPHPYVAEMLDKGWNIVDTLAGTSHGNWSFLMRWDGEGEPPK